MKFKILCLFWFCIVFSCNNISNIIPVSKSSYIEKYHCFPYEVSMYNLKNVLFNDDFFQYPRQQFCNLICEMLSYFPFIKIGIFERCDAIPPVLHHIVPRLHR